MNFNIVVSLSFRAHLQQNPKQNLTLLSLLTLIDLERSTFSLQLYCWYSADVMAENPLFSQATLKNANNSQGRRHRRRRLSIPVWFELFTFTVSFPDFDCLEAAICPTMRSIGTLWIIANPFPISNSSSDWRDQLTTSFGKRLHFLQSQHSGPFLILTLLDSPSTVCTNVVGGGLGIF